MSKTTLFAALSAALMAINVDYEKLSRGDRAELTRIGVAIMIALFGYYSADRPASAPNDPVEKRETKGVTPGADPLAKEVVVVQVPTLTADEKYNDTASVHPIGGAKP